MTPTPHEPTKPEPTGLEADPRFPSGPWTGFFLQPVLTGRHWMELQLTFREGTAQGTGRDRVGEFLIRGRYEVESGKCWWSKRYVGKHDVAYQGFNEGKGIWGTWQIAYPKLTGGFHIWPVGMPNPTLHRLSAEAEVPLDEFTEVEVAEEARELVEVTVP